MLMNLFQRHAEQAIEIKGLKLNIRKIKYLKNKKQKQLRQLTINCQICISCRILSILLWPLAVAFAVAATLSNAVKDDANDIRSPTPRVDVGLFVKWA